MTKRKNNSRSLLLNDDVLSLSVNVVENLLGLNSTSNAVYSDRTIVYHLLNACASQNNVNHINDLCIFNII
ncbi:MAG: hypothetical protein LBC39_00285 [Methanobrevibacter sp.]|nr:hypothetical protein [Candidatus Methanovirga aequatorialis]